MSELCPNGSVLGSGSFVEDVAELWLRLGMNGNTVIFHRCSSSQTSAHHLQVSVWFFKMGEIWAFSLLGAERAWHSACGVAIPTVVTRVSVQILREEID